MAGASGRPSGAGAMKSPHTRVAIPDDNGTYGIFDVEEADFQLYSSSMLRIVSKALGEKDVYIPEVALREVAENLIHAIPCSASVVIGPDMRSVYFSDTGPGIPRIDLAFELGYSTALESHRSYIRGVGIGLYLAREDLLSHGGDLRIDTDPGRGTYVHLSLAAPPPHAGWEDGEAGLRLTQRQNNILFLLSEGESLGPSRVSSELNIGVSTAHRDLVKLQELGLVYLDPTGKRFLSEVGRSYLQSLLSL
jgi:hypothetical protein